MLQDFSTAHAQLVIEQRVSFTIKLSTNYAENGMVPPCFADAPYFWPHQRNYISAGSKHPMLGSLGFVDNLCAKRAHLGPPCFIKLSATHYLPSKGESIEET